MQVLNITKAFQKRLKDLDSSFPTAYENVEFKPVKDQPYQRVRLVPFPPENPTLGDNFYREQGQFQVFLAYPAGTGINAALTKAAQIKDYFSRGTTLQYAGTEVIIKYTPQISDGTIVADRYVVPIIIEYFANILDV